MEVNKGTYQHYKGPYYELLDIVYHSETEEPLVLYKPMYDTPNKEKRIWVRPYDMFFEMLEFKGKMVNRFAYVG